MRFKIDLRDSCSFPFGLYVARRGWFGTKWERVEVFESKADAKEFYEKIKDLPEYLP